MTKGKLPILSKVDFFRHTEGDFISAIAWAIRSTGSDASLSEVHQAIVAWNGAQYDIPNGGSEQFYFNLRSDNGVLPLAVLLESLNHPKAAGILREANAIYRANRGAFEGENPWDGLFGSLGTLKKLDQAFCQFIPRCNRSLEKWIRSNIRNIAVGSDGQPIDAKLTGIVESIQPDGIRETLEVKNGKPHGAYREFFNDGSVRGVAFYKAGKLSGDFWPDGSLKRKQSKKGATTLIEWFYPSGTLKKRCILDNDESFVQPIQVFFENGQLAEQLTKVKSKKVGPWLKYFDDGSPQLQAEFQDNEKMIVHNAWDAFGVQTCKDGSGTYFHDGRSIAWQYDIYFSDWSTKHFELKDGVPHGKVTSFNVKTRDTNDVLVGFQYDPKVLKLRSESYFEMGVQIGPETVYWDNGRVRRVLEYANGMDTKHLTYTKFDDPVPVVLLTWEADENLYTKWKHQLPDEYPIALNLEAIQRRMTVPEMLREVDDRNRNGKLKSEYEDWNTFKDSIAYFLDVDRNGDVKSAFANGSGVYSTSLWNHYLPMLKDLKFSPGKLRNHPIECRVVVSVHHTFDERARAESSQLADLA